MKEYHKIQSVYKRDEKTHKFIEGQWSLPEFDYLKNNVWVWTEKVDGTNVRVIWDKEKLRFGGKSDNAQMPIFLLDRLNQIFTTYTNTIAIPPMTIRGKQHCTGLDYTTSSCRGTGLYALGGFTIGVLSDGEMKQTRLSALMSKPVSSNSRRGINSMPFTVA